MCFASINVQKFDINFKNLEVMWTLRVVILMSFETAASNQVQHRFYNPLHFEGLKDITSLTTHPANWIADVLTKTFITTLDDTQ